MSKIIQKFSSFWTQIAVDLGLMKREQSVEILTMQARFLALAEKDVMPTEKFLDADPLFKVLRDCWTEVAQEKEISETDFLHHYARASSGTGFEKHEAPASGDIANALGYISKPIKQAILTAQAAVRAEQTLTNIGNHEAKPKSIEEMVILHGRIDYAGKFDPPQLVRAQINNKEADELHLAAKTTPGKSPLDFGQELHKLRENTKNAYRDAAEMFDVLEIPASKLIAQELNRAAAAMEKQR